ncbi:MAG: DUF2586 family protein [Firmicutes bacterium]|nr:DUF2586 family protein [Bacillota bacterium]
MPGLPDVDVNILDGGLGVLPPSASGLQAKVGVCSAGTVNGITSITDPEQIVDKLGTGPLVNALFDSFAGGARIVYAVRAEGDIAGTLGEVSSVKTGQGDMTVSGAPLDAYSAVVEIMDGGALNEATFRYSLDGEDTWSKKITVPELGPYEISGTGITLTFSEFETDPADSFAAGDKYTFSSVAPQASVVNVNAAVDSLLSSSYLYEFIHIVGESDAAMWAAADVKAVEAEGNYCYLHMLCEARGPDDGEDADAWTQALLDEIANFASTRVSICAARGEILDMNTGRQVDRNSAGLYAGRVSSTNVQESPGKVRLGPVSGMLALKPDGLNDGHILALDQAGFITFRQYRGLSGFYITNGRIAAESVSDYQYVEVRRPMDKACMLVRNAALMSEHGEIDPTNLSQSIKPLEADLTQPLDIMASPANGEIARGRVVIPLDQDILATSTIRSKIRIVPMAIMRWIELEVGYENPAAAR